MGSPHLIKLADQKPDRISARFYDRRQKNQSTQNVSLIALWDQERNIKKEAKAQFAVEWKKVGREVPH